MNQQAKNDQTEKPSFIFRRHDNGSLMPGRLVPGDSQLELAPKVYEPRMFDEGPMTKRLGLFEIEPVAPPKKVYGDIHRHVTRYFRRYELHNANVGVALIGQKGSGKTTTLRCAIATALQLGMPVIMVNDRLPGEILVMLMESIQQNCLVAFEEFDKSYGAVEINEATRAAEYEHQNELLRILDGSAGGGKKLFMLLGNDLSRFSSFLQNRPGRIRYTRLFSQLPLTTLMPYVRDNLKNCTDLQLLHFKKVRELSAERFNFDMMAAIVEEMNMFNISLAEAMDDLFGSITLRGASSYLIECTHADGTVEDFEGSEMLASEDRGWVIRVLGAGSESEPRAKLRDDDFKGFRDFGPTWVTLYEKDGLKYALYPADVETAIEASAKTKSLFDAPLTEIQERLSVVRRQRWAEDARLGEAERVRRKEEQSQVAPHAADTFSSLPKPGLGLGRGVTNWCATVDTINAQGASAVWFDLETQGQTVEPPNPPTDKPLSF